MDISFKLDGMTFQFSTDFDPGWGIRDADNRAAVRTAFATAVAQYLRDLAAKAIAARAQSGGLPAPGPAIAAV